MMWRYVLLDALSPALFIALLGSFVKSANDIRMDNNERGISIVPFLALTTNCWTWLLYSAMRVDFPVLISNFFGLCVGVGGTYIYYSFSIIQPPNWQWHATLAILLVALLFFIGQQVMLEGFLAMIMSVCIYGAPLVTLAKVVEERSTQSMPFLICLGNFASSMSWTLYGLIVAKDARIVIPSIIGAILATLQVGTFIVYGFEPSLSRRK